jgi:hypothetical protein
MSVKIILCMLCLFVFAGCSSMSVEECKTTDWVSYGESDANRGWINNFSHWENVCREYGVQLDRKDYDLGYQKGLAQYCSFQNGYIMGNEGHPLPKICPPETQEKFTKGFIEGERSYQQKEALEQQTKILEESRRPERMTCHDDSDCRILDKCDYGRCEKSGKSCSHHNDCDVVGSCHFNKCNF